MKYAKKLRKGDKVAIVSLSSGMIGEAFCSHNIEIGVKRLREYGLETSFMPNSLKGIEYLKANPKARAKDLKDALDDNDWFFSNIDSDYSGIFKKIKNKILGESGIVDNFKNLDLPFLNRLKELGLAKVDNGFECGHGDGEWHIDVIDNLQLVRGSDLPFLASF